MFHQSLTLISTRPRGTTNAKLAPGCQAAVGLSSPNCQSAPRRPPPPHPQNQESVLGINQPGGCRRTVAHRAHCAPASPRTWNLSPCALGAGVRLLKLAGGEKEGVTTALVLCSHWETLQIKAPHTMGGDNIIHAHVPPPTPPSFTPPPCNQGYCFVIF